MRRIATPPTAPWFRWLATGVAALLLIAFIAPAPAQQATETQAPKQALMIDIESAIGPATADHIDRQLEEADPARVGAVILRLDTPGGLDTAMRQIIRAELASPIPVIAYVAPGGARAASAGTYITYAASVAAMAPGTNLGAATPIVIGGLPEIPGGEPSKPEQEPDKAKKPDTGKEQPKEDANPETRKMVNDAVAYIRSLAQLHGRNVEWAESAVRGAASLPADEALKLGVVDVIAPTAEQLLRQIDGREVIAGGEKRTLATAGLVLTHVQPGWRTRLLGTITDPNIAYLLMLVGIYGLIFELSNPGAILPGVLGGICLLLALFAFSALPIDYAGVALVLLGIALMVSEAFVTSFGILGLGGIVSFVIGSIIMFEPSSPNFGLSISVVVASTIVSAGFLILVLTMLLRSRRKAVVTGGAALIGATGNVIEWSGSEGRVRIVGEVWRARAGVELHPGDRIKTTGRDGLLLLVERLEEQ
ncbi:MAG TPA: nodulation protein NfeD [Dongiaceae bacterium]|jgi:membrane-bound serine protease (ClpP class)|nr:nodulation protein NfeD [Dongiaceae bacterium]